jgi:hypothetical protein
MKRTLYVYVGGTRFRPRLKLVGDRSEPESFCWLRLVPMHDGGAAFEFYQALGSKNLESVEQAIKHYFEHLHHIGARPVWGLGRCSRASWSGDNSEQQ